VQDSIEPALVLAQETVPPRAPQNAFINLELVPERLQGPEFEE